MNELWIGDHNTYNACKVIIELIFTSCGQGRQYPHLRQNLIPVFNLISSICSRSCFVGLRDPCSMIKKKRKLRSEFFSPKCINTFPAK